MIRIKTATGLITAYMRACGFAGWASFWRTIYVLPGFESDQRLLRHERKHLGADRARWVTEVFSSSTCGGWCASGTT